MRLAACQRHHVALSVAGNKNRAFVAAIAAVAEDGRVDIDYTASGAAQVAETTTPATRPSSFAAPRLVCPQPAL